MPNRLPGTPLIAAFFYALILTGCGQDSASSQTSHDHCDAQTTAIATIQGSSPASSMTGQRVTVQGIVTLVEAGHGLYIEDPSSDSDISTSNAIFVQTGALSVDIPPGSWIAVTGEITELKKGRNSLTALTDVDDVTACASGQTLPLTNISLPLKGLEREALEGMRVQLDDRLTVTDNYQLSRGKFSVSANGFQYVATEIMSPGAEAARYNRDNRVYSLPVMLTESPGSFGVLSSGTAISSITGVLSHDDRVLRVTLESMKYEGSQDFSTPDEATENDLRMVVMNLHNYFNGDGRGGEFPTPRGAKTPAEFDLQRRRLGAAIQVLNPHLLAVQELENDGFGPVSAAADFMALAQHATGTSWSPVRPPGDDTGTDQITVALFYRDDLFETVGSAHILTGPEFKRSRQPLAQVFRQRQDGEKILVAVNHLKSKGSCPDSGADANQRDGQACWNSMRVAAARKMSAWVKTLSESSGISHSLILGDMNAYR
jgi:predicted extracellular nuclease